ncbi:hypothetical protein [Methylomonas rhizoryzae]|uniref:hypothetical protein n=1 Tax=Methylomonas rhizoryzae TaxID=2608981 RepID=UPI001232F1FE|nr:hypothetical protein [Methylomonas rhizoryzae]
MTFVLPTNHPLRCTPQGNRSENNVANDIDPSDVRKEKKQTQQIDNENQKRIEAGLPVVGSFGEVALEFFEMMQTWAGYLDGLKVGASNTVQKAKINCVIHS